MLSLTKPKLIGSVCSDSGSLSIVDPTYITVSRSNKVNFPKCHLFTSFDTEIGDGEFPVYEMRDKQGRLKCIVIDIE